MPDSGEGPRGFWAKLPEWWKLILVLVAIGSTAIGGYAAVDSRYRALLEADREIGRKLDALAAAMPKPDGIAKMVETARAKVTCELGMESVIRDLEASAESYKIVVESLAFARDALEARLDLTAPEERRLLRLIELHKRFADVMAEREREATTMRTRRSLAPC